MCQVWEEIREEGRTEGYAIGFKLGLIESYVNAILSIKRHKRLINITRNTFVETNDVLLVFGEYSNIVEIFDISKNCFSFIFGSTTDRAYEYVIGINNTTIVLINFVVSR